MDRLQVGTLCLAAVLLIAARDPYAHWPKPPPPPRPAQLLHPVAVAFPEVRPPAPLPVDTVPALRSGWASCARRNAAALASSPAGANAIAEAAVNACADSRLALNRIVRRWYANRWPLEDAFALHAALRRDLVRDIENDLSAPDRTTTGQTSAIP